MASEEMMRAEYARRMERFPPPRFERTNEWWEPVNDYLRCNSRHIVTLPRSDDEKFDRGVPMSGEMYEWLMDNVGPEGMYGYNARQQGGFRWQVGGWDWLWTDNRDHYLVDMLFLEPADAVAFKIRWC